MRPPEQLALALDASAPPAVDCAASPARVLEAPPEGVVFISDEQLDKIFGPRPEASADVWNHSREGEEP